MTVADSDGEDHRSPAKNHILASAAHHHAHAIQHQQQQIQHHFQPPQSTQHVIREIKNEPQIG